MVEEIAFVCLYQQIKWQLSYLWEYKIWKRSLLVNDSTEYDYANITKNCVGRLSTR